MLRSKAVTRFHEGRGGETVRGSDKRKDHKGTIRASLMVKFSPLIGVPTRIEVISIVFNSLPLPRGIELLLKPRRGSGSPFYEVFRMTKAKKRDISDAKRHQTPESKGFSVLQGSGERQEGSGGVDQAGRV